MNMIKKNYTKTADRCRVTFHYSNEEDVDNVTLVGEFNDWDLNAHPMKKRKNGNFSTTIMLEAGRHYRFRYYLGDERWANEPEADQHIFNCYGSEDSVVII